MKVEIFPATLADAEALVAIQQKAFKRLYDIYHDEGNPYLRGTDEIEKWLSRPNSYVYKILAGGELVGGVAFWERRGRGLPGEYYLARIYILPEMQRKGIASTAITLCEATVYNANRWTLDFPIDQIANRLCYEKAGYKDVGETREQSEGKIVLALYEKSIPTFRDIKKHLDNPIVRKIMAYSAFDPTPEAMDKKAVEFRRHDSWQLYGWVKNGELLGICGFEEHSDYVEILNIAVDKNVRARDVGKGMITALSEQYAVPIKAETDDDAIDFYRKVGFEATAIQKHNKRRWVCVKPTLTPFDNETDQERRARIYPIVLSEYNPAWRQWYSEEQDNLMRLLGDCIVRIQHIGSTAVPGLMAKPTVDILLEVPVGTDFDEIIALFQQHSEYICLHGEGLTNKNEPLCILKGYTDTGFAERVFHIHVREVGSYDEPIFRNYLITHPEIATEYAALKRKLKNEYEHDRDRYTAAKGEFIKAAVSKAKEENGV